MTTNILNKIDSVVTTIAGLDLDELVIVEGLLSDYEDNREEYLKTAQAKIDEI
jgi:hypothetical protein